MNNAEQIWRHLIAAGLSPCGAAALMGNLQAESALEPTNLQNGFESKLGLDNAAYTAAVDNGTSEISFQTARAMAWRSGRIPAARAAFGCMPAAYTRPA